VCRAAVPADQHGRAAARGRARPDLRSGRVSASLCCGLLVLLGPSLYCSAPVLLRPCRCGGLCCLRLGWIAFGLPQGDVRGQISAPDA
jgi:hypothetical protein